MICRLETRLGNASVRDVIGQNGIKDGYIYVGSIGRSQQWISSVRARYDYGKNLCELSSGLAARRPTNRNGHGLRLGCY